jgi:hypothetical protein
MEMGKAKKGTPEKRLLLNVTKYLKSAKDMNAVKKEQQSFARHMNSIIERTKENLIRNLKGQSPQFTGSGKNARKTSRDKR